uniref:Ankyrin repeat protein n=1 Tax=Parastrongyloides trichosuri TaxID=131310 RepID=A0A0N4Z706_PARTI
MMDDHPYYVNSQDDKCFTCRVVFNDSERCRCMVDTINYEIESKILNILIDSGLNIINVEEIPSLLLLLKSGSIFSLDELCIVGGYTISRQIFVPNKNISHCKYKTSILRKIVGERNAGEEWYKVINECSENKNFLYTYNFYDSFLNSNEKRRNKDLISLYNGITKYDNNVRKLKDVNNKEEVKRELENCFVTINYKLHQERDENQDSLNKLILQCSKIFS